MPIIPERSSTRKVDPGSTVHLAPERAEVFDEYRDVILGILAGIGSRTGPEQHHSLKTVAIELGERGSKALEDGIVTR
jgi:hypothetical protein